MSAPTMTINAAAGNRLAPQGLGAGASLTFDVDYSTKVAGLLQVAATFATVSAAAGLLIEVFRRVGAAPGVDTQTALPAILAATASTSQARSLSLATGRYRIKLTNLDASNGLTAVSATDDTIDGYS